MRLPVKFTALLLASGGISSLFTGCSGFLPSSGISTDQVVEGHNEKLKDIIRVTDVDEEIVRRVVASKKKQLFSNTLDVMPAFNNTVGRGDVLEVSVWEAPPASLFATSAMDTQTGTSVSGKVVFPEQMVDVNGTITIPFAGTIPVTSYTPKQIESLITRRLTGKANQPQVMVRIINNVTSTVTVVGDVANSVRMPLTPKREKLLDALAASGGVRESIDKTSIQVTRGRFVQSLPLEEIIRDPSQNISLRASDIITVMSRPMSFTVFGAMGKNEEVNFEAKGITLAQALGRSGGLNDSLADATGVFIFRHEHPWIVRSPLEDISIKHVQRVPVIYRVDLKDPGSYFLAQRFPIRDKDILFASNASSIGLKRFFSVVNSMSTVVRSGSTVIVQ